MSLSDDHPTTPEREPETDQERAFLEAYRATDDAGRLIVWAALLTELGRRTVPTEE